MVAVPGGLPGRGRARPGPRPVDRRAAAAGGRRHRRGDGVRRRACWWRAELAGSGCGPAGPGGDARVAGGAAPLGLGRRAPHRRRAAARRRDRRRRRRSRAAWSPTRSAGCSSSAPYAVLAQPIHTAILPELVDRGPRARPRPGRRVAAVGARAHGPAGRAGVGRDGGAGRAGHAGGAVRRGGRRGQPSCWPRPSPAWPSACCPTAPSCCWPAATTPSATAARPGVVSLASAAVGVAVMVGRGGDGRRRGPHRRARPRPLGGLRGRASWCSAWA